MLNFVKIGEMHAFSFDVAFLPSCNGRCDVIESPFTTSADAKEKCAICTEIVQYFYLDFEPDLIVRTFEFLNLDPERYQFFRNANN